MLVINLKEDSHKVVGTSSIQNANAQNVYSASATVKKTTKKSTKKQATQNTIVLTDEQKKYLNMYETMHDQIFNTDSKEQTTKVKVYALVNQEDIEPSKKKNVVKEKKIEKPVEEIKDSKVSEEYYDMTEEKEIHYTQEDIEELDSILNQEDKERYTIEENKKSWWKRFAELIKEIFVKKQK